MKSEAVTATFTHKVTRIRSYCKGRYIDIWVTEKKGMFRRFNYPDKLIGYNHE